MTLSRTLYAVLQEFGAWLLPLLSKCNQSESFIEGQLAQESICKVNMLSNLRRTKTIWPEGQCFSVWDLTSTVVCIPLWMGWYAERSGKGKFFWTINCLWNIPQILYTQRNFMSSVHCKINLYLSNKGHDKFTIILSPCNILNSLLTYIKLLPASCW